jgi:hypothetical protein
MSSETRRVLFSRPIAIEEQTYEIGVPINMVDEEEMERYILENQDKLETWGSVERYGLNEKVWTEWAITIHPYLNESEYEELVGITGEEQ